MNKQTHDQTALVSKSSYIYNKYIFTTYLWKSFFINIIHSYNFTVNSWGTQRTEKTKRILKRTAFKVTYSNKNYHLLVPYLHFSSHTPF